MQLHLEPHIATAEVNLPGKHKEVANMQLKFSGHVLHQNLRRVKPGLNQLLFNGF
jgi:hypothetical protein